LVIVLHKGRILRQGFAGRSWPTAAAPICPRPFRACGTPREGPGAYVNCFAGIAWREGLRFFQQRGRFIAALVRPLVWLFIFAAGFRSVLGVSIIRPMTPMSV